MSETQPRVLDDLFDIPEAIRANEFVVNMTELDQHKVDKLVDEYVVTEDLSKQFHKALSLVKDALAAGRSEASYVDGSFGAGKSHFLTVLGELLDRKPNARRKEGLGSVVLDHDEWMADKKFLQVKLNLVGKTSLASAIFGAYIKTVEKEHDNAEFPALMRSDGILENARSLRRSIGDEQFAQRLLEAPQPEEAEDDDDEWGETGWSTAKLDRAFDAPHGDPERGKLVAALLTTWLSGYSSTVAGTDAYVQFDEGLSIMSRHAESLGYDGIVLLLDELVLWLSGMLSENTRVQHEAQSVSRLVEAEDWPRPIPIISFVPRQRDLQELVGRDASGAESESLFETLDHWKGRFNLIELADQNLPEIVRRRMLEPRSEAARKALDAAYAGVERTDPLVKDVLLDSTGTSGTMDEFRRSYPFSPVFLHVIVDVAEALQRNRSGIKLLSQLMDQYRHALPVGQLMPVGAIFGKLIDGRDEPVGRKLRHEFNNVSTFYVQRVRPWLLHRHGLKEEEAASQPADSGFSGEDLILKTLMLSALTPGLPALQNPTVSQLLALNHGAVNAFLPGMDVNQVLGMLRDLAAEFGEFQVGDGDNPRVNVHLIGVDVNAIVEKAQRHDNYGTQTTLVKKLLWEEIGLSGFSDPDSVHPLKWRGTARPAEAVFDNIRLMPQPGFIPGRENAVRVVIDFPFDQDRSKYPSDDENQVKDVRKSFTAPEPLTICWIPAHLTAAEMATLRELNIIDFLLERQDRLEKYASNLTSDERQQARIQLESKHKAQRVKLVGALKAVYGLDELRDADRPKPSRHLWALRDRLEKDKPPAGATFAAAFEWIAKHLLDSSFPDHPDLDAPNTGATVSKRDLARVLEAVESARQCEGGRLEIERGTSTAVLRRIANPLKIATVGENFILRDDWRPDINRELGLRPDDPVTVSKVRNTVDKLLEGLLPEVRDLIVRCYAIQDDRAWFRGGVPIDAPGMEVRLADEMQLITRELPLESEFQDAGKFAVEIFGATKRPVRTYRAVQSLAGEVRKKLNETAEDLKEIRQILAAKTGVFGIEPGSPRQVTVDQLDRLFADLGPITDPTTILRVLAKADLPKESSYYKACLTTAKSLHTQLKETKWELIERVHDGTPFMADQLEKLRKVAGEYEEHAQPLAPVLREIQNDVLSHLAAAKPVVVAPVPPVVEPTPEPIVRAVPQKTGHGSYAKRVRAKGGEVDLADLRRQILDEGGEWEVTARRLD